MNFDEDRLRAAQIAAEKGAARHLEALRAIEHADPLSPKYDGKQLDDEYQAASDNASAAHKRLTRERELVEAKRNMPINPFYDDSEETGGRAGRGIRVTGESLTYERGGPHSFLRDQYTANKGDREAVARLASHTTEMVKEGFASERAIAETAGAGGEYVTPAYLNQQHLALQRAGRPYIDSLSRMPLPPDTNRVTLPRLATGTAVAAQADLGAVQATDPTTGSVDVPVITQAGQVDMARQLFDRSVPGMDEVLFADLIADYNTKVDVQALSGSGAAPNALGVLNLTGVNSISYTDASPTLPELYGKIADAIQQVHSNRFLAPSVIVMHPRRWGWALAQLDTTNRPLIVPVAGAASVMGVLENVEAQAVVGTMLGLPVLVDPNIPINRGVGANEDAIIVQRVQDSWLMENEPLQTRVYEEVLSGTLSIRVQVFNYLGITHARYPKSISVISGTGCTQPTF
ncbi:MAG: phage major capsid protein [Thermoleophilaceae bacterium]